MAGSKPLQLWREEGRWSATYDRFWQDLQDRYGRQAGTRLMIELLQAGRQYGYEELTRALEETLSLGTVDVGAVHYLLKAATLAPRWQCCQRSRCYEPSFTNARSPRSAPMTGCSAAAKRRSSHDERENGEP